MPESEGNWHKCEIDRRHLKGVMRRTDLHGLIRFGSYILLLSGSGILAYMTLGSWWMVPAFLLYGFIWSFANIIGHETSHGTAFRTRALNETVFYVSGFMMQQEPVALRWMHARHHTSTSRDPDDVELILANPMSWREFILQLSGLPGVWLYNKLLVQFFFGHADATVKESVPKQARRQMFWNARVFLSIYLAIIVWAVLSASWTPIFMVFLPRIIGAPVNGLLRITQHAGLATNVTDHRFNSRTMYLGPVLRFLYWNMNYHIEHHMFPMVPFHALPKLHEHIKAQLPPSSKGLIGAYREILYALRRQKKQPDYVLGLNSQQNA